MVISNEEKNRSIVPSIFVAIIAPILTCLVIPLYDSFVSESVKGFHTPFLDIAMQNQILGLVFHFLFVESPTILFSLVLAVSIVLLLKAPKQRRVTGCIIAFVISLIFLMYAAAIIFNPALQRIGELIYPYGSDYSLIACFIYAALLVYISITRKAN